MPEKQLRETTDTVVSSGGKPLSDGARKRRLVAERDGWRCARCPAEMFLTLDHIVPVSRGGNNALVNLQLLCVPCNQAKADMLDPADLIRERMATKKRIRQRLTRSKSKFNFKHHRYCDANYCFCECEVFLAEHPQLRSAIRRIA